MLFLTRQKMRGIGDYMSESIVLAVLAVAFFAVVAWAIYWNEITKR